MEIVIIGVACVLAIAIILFSSMKSSKDLVSKVETKIASAIGGKDKIDSLQKILSLAVASVKQDPAAAGKTDAEKKAMAIDIAFEMCKLAGHEDVSRTLLSSVVEGAYLFLKTALKIPSA